eukprot:gene2226-biopygen14030
MVHPIYCSLDGARRGATHLTNPRGAANECHVPLKYRHVVVKKALPFKNCALLNERSRRYFNGNGHTVTLTATCRLNGTWRCFNGTLLLQHSPGHVD